MQQKCKKKNTLIEGGEVRERESEGEKNLFLYSLPQPLKSVYFFYISLASYK